MDSINIIAAAFTGSNSQGQARVYAGIISRLDNNIGHGVPRVRRYTATASCGTVLGFLFGGCFFSGDNGIISLLHFFRRAVTQYADEPVVIIFPADLFDSVIVKKIGNGFFLVVGFVILVSFRSGVPGGSLGTFTLRTLERFQRRCSLFNERRVPAVSQFKVSVVFGVAHTVRLAMAERIFDALRLLLCFCTEWGLFGFGVEASRHIARDTH